MRGAAVLVQVAILSHVTFGIQAGEVLVINRSPTSVQMTHPESRVIGAEESIRLRTADADTNITFVAPDHTAVIPQGSFVMVEIGMALEVNVYDTNDVQLELSAAAHVCVPSQGEPPEVFKCIADTAFGGGLPETFAKDSFLRLWQDLNYWRLCNQTPAAEPIRTQASGTGHTIDILREKPMVATIRGFVNAAKCKELLQFARLDSLVRAHVGSGGGATSTSEARETLTANMFVNWHKTNALSLTAAKTFDVASELLVSKVPYEGQEPINFLHYLKGFEYKPHTDGGRLGKGKRVATTLIYCEAAEEGGATVFPMIPLRFQPSSGDLLFFEYAPDPNKQLHAACPVVVGNKSTLTQWHRLGVSPEEPWDNFEDWGKFHNPHGQTRWGGPRYEGLKHEEL